MNNKKTIKPRCCNCEYANTRLTDKPFVFCYVKWCKKLRCSHCKSHRFKMRNNITNNL